MAVIIDGKAVSKKILDYIPDNTFFGFDQLMHSLIQDNQRVKVKVHEGYWLDIGRPDDYQIATSEFEKNKYGFLKEIKL